MPNMVNVNSGFSFVSRLMSPVDWGVQCCCCNLGAVATDDAPKSRAPQRTVLGPLDSNALEPCACLSWWCQGSLWPLKKTKKPFCSNVRNDVFTPRRKNIRRRSTEEALHLEQNSYLI